MIVEMEIINKLSGMFGTGAGGAVSTFLFFKYLESKKNKEYKKKMAMTGAMERLIK